MASKSPKIREAYLYIIRVSRGRDYLYKIGESLEVGNRTKKLIDKYTKQYKNAEAELVADNIFLTRNNLKRLNDKSVHQFFDEDKQLYRCPENFLHSLTGCEDGKDECFYFRDSDQGADWVRNYTQQVVDTLSADERNFTADVQTEDDILDERKHLVNYDQMNEIDRFVQSYTNQTFSFSNIQTFSGLNILLIGQWLPDWIATIAMQNNVYVIHDTENDKHCYDFAPLNKKIRYIGKFSEIKEIHKMCAKFDFIIANPPYAIGNDITAAVRKNCDFDYYINLMPVSKYKKNELFKYVADIEKAEDKFEDATVGDCLAVAELSKHETGKYETWDDFSLMTYDEKFRKFYEENRKRVTSCRYIYRPKTLDEIDGATCFCVPIRAVDHGTDMSGGAYDWNVNEFYNAENVCYDITNKRFADSFYSFVTKDEKSNFTDFWYRNGKTGLMSRLIKGLNKTCGPCEDAIPRVDWSHPWTDREILADYGYTEEEINEILQ